MTPVSVTVLPVTPPRPCRRPGPGSAHKRHKAGPSHGRHGPGRQAAWARKTGTGRKGGLRGDATRMGRDSDGTRLGLNL